VLYEQLTGRVPVEHAGRNLAVVLPINGGPAHLHASVKRFADLSIASLGLVLTVLLLPLVWLAHRIESPGSVFYRQRRVGQGGRLFYLLKFRTMSPDAEPNGPRWAQVHDDRITRVGRILRRLHLDEAPQALNILRGDLSFMGPRPERPEFVMQLERQIPFYRARHAVRPGVTGWAQVNYDYGASVEDALTKLQYDLYYIKHQSLWLDLLILAKTLGLILTMRGR
jgi:lipopolysaccharide/colanic/teichoic acid biosynthesis glycosyltransferase